MVDAKDAVIRPCGDGVDRRRSRVGARSTALIAGLLSSVISLSAAAGSGADAFEDDDAVDRARPIRYSTDPYFAEVHFGHLHTLHDVGDTDWIYFPVLSLRDYYLLVLPNADEDLVVTAYAGLPASRGPMNPASCVQRVVTEGIELECTEPETTVIHVEIKSSDPNDFGPDRGYEVRLGNYGLTPPDPVLIQGTVTDSVTGAPVPLQIIKDDQDTPTLADSAGFYQLSCGRGARSIDTSEGQYRLPDNYEPLIVDIIAFFSDPDHCPNPPCVFDEFGGGDLNLVPGQVLPLNLRVKPKGLVMRTSFEEGESFEAGASN